ncbi:hypothetical protein [Bythopirellula goksoeyrii]|uniref:Uncharacterized protein n=1 Tax=Bythopirellula goksoeyrii TaxID=1400387 RepID=A0A5B9Q6H6_9BACT|nr:hypothetical protein [Bythopirellula goksoeyrii]QEG33319.1 hypothetical protein Pr1d_05800 [Bythopirellula goksoeyrii]
MKLPQFGIKALLAITTLVALWCSTLTAYTGSDDIQVFIWTAIIVMSGAAAGSYSGRRRAYWAGFCGAMLLMSMKNVFVYGAALRWTSTAARALTIFLREDASYQEPIIGNVDSTLMLIIFIAASAVIGWLSVFVYDQCSKAE